MLIGFVGLGNVGAPMAINLLKAGFDVIGFDLRPNAVFESMGGRTAKSLEEVATQATTVVHSLPNEVAVEQSVSTLLRHPCSNRVLIEMSSYALESKMGRASRMAAAGATMLDCEISGLPIQVAERKAVIFKSGDAETIEELKPVFDGIADRHFNLGPLGAATKMKLIANMMVCVHNLMAAEALNLGRLAGLSPEQMVQVIGPSAAGSSTFVNKSPLMVERKFENGTGPFRHMFGYLARANELAEELEASTPLLQTALRVYDFAKQEKRHDQDIAAIIEIIEDLKRGRGSDGRG
ncbi:NAD(P)-dependent oxidoreductase [Bradyrhizobium jicamae]|uniref:NAD(P)-dependent oxidoreductase n=1 Tax=Bradyrhizobium jicamae TaxID=280332 RepID=UPI001BA9535C|nr:NAD(P)-dependent oxidoreductase [Bradyrhizobium jicamae]MBR0755295.1 NAD(P)-dependent oxidoreductase [Bradyrhizobium jicamae]